MPEVTTLTEAVTAAVDNLNLEGLTDGGQTVEETKVSTKSEEKKETPETPKGLSEADLLSARQLYEGLNDPTKAPIIIKFLAEQHGYRPPETKAEEKAQVKEVTDDVLGVLKATLGSEFDFLSEKLAPAIKQIVKAQVQENTKDLRERQETFDKEKEKAVFTSTIDELGKDYFPKGTIPEDFLAEMTKTMEDITPGTKTSVAQYAKLIFSTVAGQRGLTKVNKTQQDKNLKNRTNVPDRLGAPGVVAKPSQGAVLPKSMSLKESIEAAMESLEAS